MDTPEKGTRPEAPGIWSPLNNFFFQLMDRAQQFQVGLHGAIKTLTQDSKLLKSAKATHSKEVKTLKAEIAKLSASSAEGWEKAKKLIEELKSAREDALTECKEPEDFHEEAMTHADMHARNVVDKWLECEVGKQFLLDLGEANYDLGYQDAKKKIVDQLMARDATFSPTRWGFLSPATPVDDQGFEDVTLNASTDTAGGEIPMDIAYLNSSANLNSVAGMDHDPVPTLTEEGQGDTVANKEEDPSVALQLKRQRSRSSELNPPIGPTEVDTDEIPQSEA
nr:MAP7 domain-containing protein 1-like [Ipomoea batatas]